MCWVLIRQVLACLAVLCFLVVSLHGCGGSSDAPAATTTTTTTPDGTIELTFTRVRFGAGGGSDSCRVASSPIKFTVGEAVTVTADDFQNLQRDRDCVEVNCDMGTGSCAQVTVSEITDPSNINVSFQPISFGIASSDLCEARWQERVVAKANEDAELCAAHALNVICIEPIDNGISNMWEPGTSYPFSRHVCSDANPRRRCFEETCWEVAKEEACPSEPGSCTLDPTCDCGEGMVKTTIVGGADFGYDMGNSTIDFRYDMGTWCWRCDKETHNSCPAQKDEFIFSPDECTSQSCDCIQSTGWPTPLIKQTWYTDPQRTSMVKKHTPGAIPCYSCGGPGAYYTQYQPMNIAYTVGLSVSLSSPPSAKLEGVNDSADIVSSVLI